MASKLLTTQTSSEGTDEGLGTRAKVIGNIKSALEAYLGTSTTIIVFAVSDDEHSAEHCDPTQDHPGQMIVAITNAIVIPDMTGTNLMCNSTTPSIYARLFLCTETTDPTHTRFLFAWHVKNPKWQWYIGAPYLSVEVQPSPAVPFSRENITKQVWSAKVLPIEHALATMIVPGHPATLFKDPIFEWTKDGNDDNFQVSKAHEASGNQLYWEATPPAVTLTAGVPLSGRFKFTQTS